jgi:hypothetical protein
MPRTSARLTRVLATSLAIGCVGEIGSGEGTPAGAPRPPGTPTGSGQPRPGTGGSPATTEPPRLPQGALDPGRITLRRLNRTEYNNTIRDLLGTSLRPADAFEVDPTGFGFDNNGDVQTLTTLQIEQYQGAAEAVIAEATTGGLDRLAAAARTAVCDPAAGGLPCTQRLAAGLARRAWRRPVADDELERVMRLVRASQARGEDALAQLRIAMVAVLISPHFLFRSELDPDPRSLAPHPVAPFEMASRLSYLIYRSMPDDLLLDAAEKGRLKTEADVRREVGRMLADPRGGALLEGFVGQWLDLDELGEHDVDPALFGKAFDGELARAMRTETLAFFGEFLQQNLPVPNLLDARFTFVDARLSQHYGLGAGTPGKPTRVELKDGKRAGLITQGSVLTTTSLPNRTSPVARGAWVLARLLCAPPPPPPPDVPPLPEGELQAPTTARVLLEMHRKDPNCAACHALIDPIGLGLENYDAIGRWRDKDQGVAIDATGALPDGSRFQGAVELGALLAKDARVASCLASNLFTYATGRHAEGGSQDDQQVQRILATTARGSAVRLQDLVLGVVASEPLRMRRGESAAMSKGGQP